MFRWAVLTVDLSKYPADFNEWTAQNLVDYTEGKGRLGRRYHGFCSYAYF